VNLLPLAHAIVLPLSFTVLDERFVSMIVTVLPPLTLFTTIFGAVSSMVKVVFEELLY
jgi:hypothetical protein